MTRQSSPEIGELSLLDRLAGYYDARCVQCSACVGWSWPWWRKQGSGKATCARCDRLAAFGEPT